MRLWLNRTGQISLRDQLVTKIELSILGREVLPGEKLPSTRELARRFGIHANTVSAAYRQLENSGWIESRHGSGVYVCAAKSRTPTTLNAAVDRLIGELAVRARRLGAGDELLRERMRKWLELGPPRRWLLIEPDPELACIVREELAAVLKLKLEICTPDECSSPHMLHRSMPLVLPSKAHAVRSLLPAGTELMTLAVQPVAPNLDAHLKRYLPKHGNDLIGVASRWNEFQRIAAMMLIAAGIKPENLLVRNATKRGWKLGLEETSAVLCDAALARELPKSCFAIVFRLIAPGSIDRLQAIEAGVAGSSGNL